MDNELATLTTTGQSTGLVDDTAVSTILGEDDYIKWVDNGTTQVEVDYVNMIENVGGVDRMAQTRAVLGI